MPRNLGELGFTQHYIIPSNYWMPSIPGQAGSWSVSLNAMRLVPIIPGRAGTLNGVAIFVAGTPTPQAGSVARMGIYSSVGGLPGSLIADFGTVTTDVASTMETITGLSVSLEPKLYFLAAVVQTGTCGLRAGLTHNVLIGQKAGSPTDQVNCAYEYTGVSGALPSGPLGTPNSTANSGPMIFFRMT